MLLGVFSCFFVWTDVFFRRRLTPELFSIILKRNSPHFEKVKSADSKKGHVLLCYAHISMHQSVDV